MDNITTLRQVREYDFKYNYYFEVENRFNNEEFLVLMKQKWHRSIAIGAAYIFLIFLLKKYMESRPKYELRIPLVLWNFSLAIFSIYGAFFRLLPELIFVLYKYGFKYSVCDNTAKTYNTVGMFWIYLFTMSKVVELGDTAFIVLRGQKLIFLHWYHHITVLVNVWFSIGQANASGRWFVAVNFTVHAFMYSYYFFKAMKFRVPKWVSVFVTSLQLVQMIIGCYVNYTCYMAIKNKETCEATMDNINFSIMIYFSYLLLFGSFFYKSYIYDPSKKFSKEIKQQENDRLKKVE